MSHRLGPFIAVTLLNLRSVPERLGSSMVTVIGIAGVVAVLISVLALSIGLRQTIDNTARADRAIVLSRGAKFEGASGLSHEAVAVGRGAQARFARLNLGDRVTLSGGEWTRAIHRRSQACPHRALVGRCLPSKQASRASLQKKLLSMRRARQPIETSLNSVAREHAISRRAIATTTVCVVAGRRANDARVPHGHECGP